MHTEDYMAANLHFLVCGFFATSIIIFEQTAAMAWRLVVSGVLAGAAAQLEPALLATCSMGSISVRIAELNEACCITTTESDCGGPCNTNCVAVLFPLLNDCGTVLNAMTLYDTSDGVADGMARGLTKVYAKCLTIPAGNIIDTLKTTQDRGQCPPIALDGVAETEVLSAGCFDL